MNTEKTLKNSIISVSAQILSLLLQFVNRRIFVIFLDIEFLGYQSLFGNIFSILSVAELGVGNIISFHLYKEIAENNKEEIGKLMFLYKRVYRIIAIAVLLLGIVCSLLIPYIVTDASASNGFLYLIYFLQLGSIVLVYLLSYKRTIYIAGQQEYKCIQIDLYVMLIIQIIQIGALAIFKKYILYLIIQISTNIFANIIISMKAGHDYPYLKEKYSILPEDIQKWNIIPDIKNFLIHKICYAIYGGTDNVVISAFCGIKDVALYGNYFLLQKGVLQILFYKLLDPVQATIGNIVYSRRKKEELWNQFQVLDVFSFFFASYIAAGFLVFFQPTIQLWMGKEYLLPFEFVIAYSITIYFGAVWEIVYKYRCVFGEYSQDRNCMIISAVLNIVISILCAKKYGVTGVQIGTLAGFMPIAYGRIRFVIKHYFGQSAGRYICRHLLLSAAAALDGIICCFFTYRLPVNAAGMLDRLLVWALVPLVINTAVYIRNNHFKEMLVCIRKMVHIIKEKIMAGNK